MKKITIALAIIIAALITLPICACRKDEEEKINAYDICVEYDSAKQTLSGTCSLTYYNQTQTQIDQLCFNLWGNAYREGAKYSPVKKGSSAFWANKNYGSEKVTAVEGCASWEVGGEDENILYAHLQSPLYPDQSTCVTISYTLDLAKVNHRTGITQNTVNLGNFYPILCARNEAGYIETPYYQIGDPFVSDCANYKVSLTTPLGYTAATSGAEIESKSEEGKTTTVYSLEKARDFAIVLSSEFKSISKKCNQTVVTAYYCGNQQPQTQLAAACESLEYFAQTFGEYAYPTLSIAFTQLNCAGMEYPALAMINSPLTQEESVYTTVHETAHQWWYAAVGNNQVTCPWQDEGLAEYSTLAFFEKHPSYGYTRTGLLGNAIKGYRAYYSVYNQIFGKSDTSMTRSLKEYSGEYEYVNIAYNKSLLAFECVRTAMGDAKFFKGLKKYYSTQKFKIATPETLIACLDELYDVQGLIEGYLNGKVVI